MRTSDEERAYRQGYYEGWCAALAKMDALSTMHISKLTAEGEYLDADGSLAGDSVDLAYDYAEEDCERYAYGPLQAWQYGDYMQSIPPPSLEIIVEANTAGKKASNE